MSEGLAIPSDGNISDSLLRAPRRPHVKLGATAPSFTCMSSSSDLPMRPKLTAEERRQRDADWIQTIRLRMLVGQALHDRGITTPAAIGAAIGMPVAEATKLMIGKQLRAGDVALLEAAATTDGS